MFDFFKRWKKPQTEKQIDFAAALLSLNDTAYANAMQRFVEEMEPATRAHVLVAYQNLILMLSALYSHDRTVTIENTIQKIYSDLYSYRDEINSRRMTWFLSAALLGRLEKIARANSAVELVATKIWCILVSELPRLKMLLPDDIVWKEDEKRLFDLSVTDAEMIQSG